MLLQSVMFAAFVQITVNLSVLMDEDVALEGLALNITWCNDLLTENKWKGHSC